ncbi:hypothetical protein [Virgisporangium aurantiacum]|uniref:hypothetical protein n=1 Tax=Virgisporangium aurantiacum TaxID=175570 RepID=UPI00194E882F|nr:hypothetical protein [Virgisporangium aurantiacum]
MAFFDPQTGSLREVDRERSDAGRLPVRGHYGRLDGAIAVFYRFEGDLFVWLRGRSWRATTSFLKWRRDGAKSQLVVSDGGGAKAAVAYETESGIEHDPTPFVEDEDFDFGLYVSNVLNDEERSSRIYQE